MATLLLLPPYLVPLPESNPAYAGLNNSAYDFAYGPNPGDGNLKEFEIVSFTEAHDAYRLYGGNATECGYWWILAGETTATAASSSGANCFPQDPANVDFTTYAQDLFAVCPEWNSGTFIRRCTIPVGYNAIVGIGQSVNCSTTDILTPNQNVLQLNGNVCDAAATTATITVTPTSSPTTTSASTRLYRRPESQNITLNRQSNGTANDDDDDVDDELVAEEHDDDSVILENIDDDSNATTTTAPSSSASTTVSSAACVSCDANQENLFLSSCVIMCPTSASPSSLSPTAQSPAATSSSTVSSSINNRRPYYYTTGLSTMVVVVVAVVTTQFLY